MTFYVPAFHVNLSARLVNNADSKMKTEEIYFLKYAKS